MTTDEYIDSHIEAEHPYLHALWRATYLHLNYPRMASGHLQGQLLRMLVQMIRPRLVLEIGTFSGYSALAMASAMEPGTMLHTFETNDEQEDFTRPWIEGSPWADRITFHIGDAIAGLQQHPSPDAQAVADTSATPALPHPTTAHAAAKQTSASADAGTDVFPQGTLFDLVFIDADKRHYTDYYRAVCPHVRRGGYIIADNTLWDNHVADVATYHPTAGKQEQLQGILDFNDLVAADTAVEKVILPLRDGLTIIRKR